MRRPSDNVLVLCWRDGSAHAVNDGALHLMFSDDDGTTWTAEDTTLGGGAVSGFPMNPTVSAGEDAGEPWLYVAPNGDLLLHMWRVDYNVSNGGTWQTRSTDGGETWTTPTQVDFTGIAGDDNIFATDDHFVHSGTIYAAARVWNAPSPTSARNILVTSDDSGATWDYVSDITTVENTQEVGMEYVGESRIVAVARGLGNDKTWQIESADMGATWGTPVDVSATVGVSGRHRIYTLAHLRGETDWWTDPNLIMCGFVFGSPGSSHPRRNSIWLSQDRGVSWLGPFIVDVQTEDAGYGDLFHDPVSGGWVYVSYQGTLDAAVVRRYNLAIVGA